VCAVAPANLLKTLVPLREERGEHEYTDVVRTPMGSRHESMRSGGIPFEPKRTGIGLRKAVITDVVHFSTDLIPFLRAPSFAFEDMAVGGQYFFQRRKEPRRVDRFSIEQRP